jgi:hypothetical protein
MGKNRVLPWDHQKHLERNLTKRNLSPALSRAISFSMRDVCVGDKVNTPKGIGRVKIIEDDVVCVDVDPASSILYEFSKQEITLAKRKHK